MGRTQSPTDDQPSDLVKLDILTWWSIKIDSLLEQAPRGQFRNCSFLLLLGLIETSKPDIAPPIYT